MGVPMDRDQWSESSKRSCAYHYIDTTYEDIRYCCRKCGVEAIFLAEEQKLAYEVKKQYIWKRRTLCGACNGELYRLTEMDKEFQRRWVKERFMLRTDRKFLADWLAVLEAIPTFKPRTRSSMKKRLESLLAAPA